MIKKFTVCFFTCTLLLILVSCGKIKLNTFLNYLNNESCNFKLTINVYTDSSNYTNILHVSNNKAYGYSIINDEITNEVYFENIVSMDYKTCKKINGEFKYIDSPSDYNSYLGNRYLKDQKFSKLDDYYVFNRNIAEFKIYVEGVQPKIILTNLETLDYVVYIYEFDENYEITLPISF